MEKIVFFGDSYTYGIGLSDCMFGCPSENLPPPSKLGWANLLCEMRNASGRNLSVPGASNLQILWTLLNTKIDPAEIIIIQWSFWDRDCLLDDKIIKIGPWIESSESYYELHSNSDMIKRNWLNINHGLLWLQQQPNLFFMLGNIRNYRGPSTTLNWLKKYNALPESENNILKLTDAMIPYFFAHFWCYTAEDNDHAGPKTNAHWAEFVNNLLDSKLKG